MFIYAIAYIFYNDKVSITQGSFGIAPQIKATSWNKFWQLFQNS
jgi:hypothetical protein